MPPSKCYRGWQSFADQECLGRGIGYNSNPLVAFEILRWKALLVQNF